MATVASRAAESFVIEGGRPLNGTIRAAGNKNGALPILAACLLTDEPVVLRNVPHIRDVETMVELLADIGVQLDPRVDPARGATARALRPCARPASGRRRDRAPPRRRPHRRARAPRRRD